MGMSAVVRERIFEPFFTTKPPGRGTGLGLAMVASIVKRATGHIDVETTEGHGTRFTIRLPIPSSDAPDAEASPARASHGTPGGRPVLPSTAGSILLVDDDTPVRRATRRMLERAGYEVVEAADGAVAIELLARPELRFDALVTDLMMPGISGREVIARARALRAFLPILCITGYAAERSSDESLSALVHDIVAKPFTGDALHRAIASAIASGRAESARARAAASS
jgi:CheY-like chemotaxis protein